MSTIRVALTDEQYAEPEQQNKDSRGCGVSLLFHVVSISLNSQPVILHAMRLLFGPLPKRLQFSQVSVLPADLFDKPLIQARTVYANVPELKEPLDRNLVVLDS